MRVRSIFCFVLLCAASAANAQERGATRLHALVNGLTVTPRVLLIGARPTDADADLIAWLARGHHVQTGFLSLTRGESAPNFTGLETGATLGAVHVLEALAARKIDGGEQYFTRAFDFGTARNATEAFEKWDRTTLLDDVVTIVRSFRPHVIVALSAVDTTDRDGQRQVSAIMAREVFDAAADTVRFPAARNGRPWTPLSLYGPGEGAVTNTGAYDRVIGRTYAELGSESRAQLRSFGFAVAPWQFTGRTSWKRIATRVADSVAAGTSSLFAGIDTSFLRLHRSVPTTRVRNAQGDSVDRPLVSTLPEILAYADSARIGLDLRNPGASVPHLRRVADLVSTARRAVVGCNHPSRDAVMSVRAYQECRASWLDFDASLDLLQRRSSEALLAAAGITYEVFSDREFHASRDTAMVTVTVFNNGESSVRLNDVSLSGGIQERMLQSIVVPPGGRSTVQRMATTSVYAHPWWIWQRKENFYPPTFASLDGVPRMGLGARSTFSLPGVAIPEDIRRLSDVDLTVTIGMTTVSASIGGVVHKTAEPIAGVRDVAMSGVPAVAIRFDRTLEWARSGKPLRKPVTVALRSFSDKPQTVTLKAVSPSGDVRIDSVPPAITLAPRESRDVSILLRGAPREDRYDLPLIGITGSDTLEAGFRTAQYGYLPPLHLFREPNVSVRGVDVEIPQRLSVAYVRGAGEETDVALKSLGIPVWLFNNEGLTRMDIDQLSTVVIGPNAFRVDRALLTQMPRLTEFARKGGTVLILDNPEGVSRPGILPYPVNFAQPFVEQVTREDAPVVAVDARSRVLTWPNAINDFDYGQWVGPRSLALPSSVDARWSQVVEMHDKGQKENRNGILVATVGKGRIVYTSLTLTQQIAGGVPGAMRLFINLLSAGLPVEGKVAKSDSK